MESEAPAEHLSRGVGGSDPRVVEGGERGAVQGLPPRADAQTETRRTQAGGQEADPRAAHGEEAPSWRPQKEGEERRPSTEAIRILGKDVSRQHWVEKPGQGGSKREF